MRVGVCTGCFDSILYVRCRSSVHVIARSSRPLVSRAPSLVLLHFPAVPSCGLPRSNDVAGASKTQQTTTRDKRHLSESEPPARDNARRGKRGKASTTGKKGTRDRGKADTKKRQRPVYYTVCSNVLYRYCKRTKLYYDKPAKIRYKQQKWTNCAIKYI